MLSMHCNKFQRFSISFFDIFWLNRQCSTDFRKKFVRIPVDAILKSLPDLHLSTLTAEQGDDVLISAKKVIFVTSFLRFSYVLCR